ncbi:MAG: tryptophan-rich sensory protein [Chitinophagales bacterium]|nr:tryptophan-rich sensory protein [Chitinophagales bacterium]
MLLRVIIFLLINFAALGIGGLFTGKGVASDWYQDLNKAPWTPPGWVFGFAWTLIMICFSVYMAKLFGSTLNKQTLIVLFAFQWVLNVSWNPVFFYYNQVAIAMIIIVLLTLVVAFFLVKYNTLLSWWSVLILPYLLWLIVATSLNGYILLKN